MLRYTYIACLFRFLKFVFRTSTRILTQDTQRTCNVNTEARSYYHCCSKKKTISVTYSDRVFVALGNPLVMHVHCIVLSSVTCLAVQSFSTLSQKRQDIRG